MTDQEFAKEQYEQLKMKQVNELIHDSRIREHFERFQKAETVKERQAISDDYKRWFNSLSEEEQKAETGSREVYALPECDTREAKEIRDLAEDLERDARTAAMAADVPVIQFPDEDEKYHASRKYGYV